MMTQTWPNSSLSSYNVADFASKWPTAVGWPSSGLASEAYDLIICDLVMPDVDGIAVYRAVQQRPEPHPPMLFLSGYYDTGGCEGPVCAALSPFSLLSARYRPRPGGIAVRSITPLAEGPSPRFVALHFQRHSALAEFTQ
jgi:hypothetical protein